MIINFNQFNLELNKENAESTLIQLAQKNLWHNLFDHTPSVLALFENAKATDIFQPFIQWVIDKNLPVQWTLHLYLMEWLLQQPTFSAKMNAGIIKELLMAAAKRWLLNGMDHAAAKGLLIASPHLPLTGIGIWKNSEPDLPAKTVVLKVPQHFQPKATAYSMTLVWGKWELLSWTRVI